MKELSSSFYQWVFFLSIYEQKSCGLNTKILTACWRYKPEFFFSLHKAKMSKLHRSSAFSLTHGGVVNH